jgi:uncharacterized protein YbjT (DUF2867 family)
LKCIIAGASGLVGQNLLKLLIEDNQFDSITVLTRTPLKTKNKNINNVIISFDDLSSMTLPSADVVFCCLGTTIKVAGSKSAFYKVDHDYIVNYAHACRKAGAKTFIVISSLGADRTSKVFYNKVKGQTEDDLIKIDFTNLFILRPSLLIGKRDENRFGEDIAQSLSGFLRPMMIGPLKKIRPIDAIHVAHRMKILAIQSKSSHTGLKIISNEEI